METDNKAPTRRVFKFDILYFVAVFFAILLIRGLLVGQSHVKVDPYSEMQSLIEKNGVTDLFFGPTEITGGNKSAALYL